MHLPPALQRVSVLVWNIIKLWLVTTHRTHRLPLLLHPYIDFYMFRFVWAR